MRNALILFTAFFLFASGYQQRPGQRQGPPDPQEKRETTTEEQLPEVILPPPPPPGLLPLREIAEIDPSGFPLAPLLFHEEIVVVFSREGVVEAYLADTGEFCWKLGFPEQEVLPPKPIPEGLLLSLSSGSLIFVDTLTGEILKEISTPLSLGIAPLPDSTVYYLASPDGDIIAFDPSSEEVHWQTDSGEPPAALSKGGGLIVVSGAQSTLTAIDASNGQVRWTRRARGGFIAPVVFDAKQEKLYIGNRVGTFFCLSAENGKVHYRWETGATVAHPVLVEEDRVYVVSYANTVFAYRAGKGHELWRVNIPGRPASGPIRVRSRIIVSTLNGDIIEIDPSRGRRGGPPYKAPQSIRPNPTFYPPYVALRLYRGSVLLLDTAPPPLPELPPKQETAPTPPKKSTQRR